MSEQQTQVSGLYIYPVKSLRGIELNHSHLEADGLQSDRRWMVVNAEGKMITQRQHATLCLVNVSLHASGILLQTGDMPTLNVAIPAQQQKNLRVRVWEDEVQAQDAGDAAAAWFSQFLGQPCRLVYFPDDEFRQVDLTYAKSGDRTAFSDGFPLLLISQPSLDDLNQRLVSPIPMQRFRPNLVVSGCDAFAEDGWKRIRIGEISFRLVKPCSRCVIPSIDIETAQKSDEPTRTLASYRRRDNKIFFGQNVIAEHTGRIEVGMPVEIIE